jgi:hypothetical protein
VWTASSTSGAPLCNHNAGRLFKCTRTYVASELAPPGQHHTSAQRTLKGAQESRVSASASASASAAATNAAMLMMPRRNADA